MQRDPAPAITIDLALTLRGTSDEPPSYDTAMKVVDQVCSDALHGTFGVIGGLERATLQPQEVLPQENENGRTGVTFKLGLPADLLPGPTWVLQHLVGIVAGDLIPSSLAGCEVEGQVRSVSLGRDFEDELLREFRMERANDAVELRRRFALSDEMPLLGYAFKPRSGTSFEDTRRITLDVLGAGFNYVVLDTRNTDVRPGRVAPWLDLVEEAASLDVAHVTAFSPNLSMPTMDLLPIVEAVLDRYPPGAPPVLKVDGGLDGISSIQAVRREFPEAQPIISTYPLLQLPRALPRETFLYFLGLSGADLGYPGGRPKLPNEVRPIWTEEATALRRAVATYDRVLDRGWPTPLVAGGLHPGQLHALYELFGPRVGIFLGGGVATHRDGPAAGARLCTRIIREAAQLAAQARKRGVPSDALLEERNVRDIEQCYGDITYLPPTDLLAGTNLRRWYERSS